MKISKISMAIIAATAVMAVSPAVFAQADTNAPAAGAQPPRAGGRGGMITIEAIDKAVTLTDAEKPKVKDALDEYTKAATEARAADQSERRAKMTAARDALDKKMKEILTPDQFTKYQAMPRPGQRRNGAGGGAGGGGATPAQ
jgi:periplasmic protein CpxP/Spy